MIDRVMHVAGQAACDDHEIGFDCVIVSGKAACDDREMGFDRVIDVSGEAAGDDHAMGKEPADAI